MPARGGARAHENTPIGAGHARDTEPPTLTGPCRPIIVTAPMKTISPPRPRTAPGVPDRSSDGLRPAEAAAAWDARQR